MSNSSLIDLSEMTLDEYFSMESYMNENMVITEASEEKYINDMIHKLEKVNTDLNNKKINEDSIKEMQSIMEELDQVASKIRKKKMVTYGTLSIVTKAIQIVEKIHDIYKFCKGIGLFDDTPEDETKEKEKFNLLKAIVDITKSVFSKDFLKSTIKSIFNLKSIAFKVLGALIKVVNVQSTKYYKYEKSTDKAYEMILKLEAKMMVEKRKAKENKDKESEAICDKVIETAEVIKKERIRQKAIVDKAKNESVLFEYTYQGNEEKLNTFKLVCRDINEAMNINISNLRKYCDTALYIARRVKEVSDSNVESKINSMKSKIEECKEYVEDVDRQYDERSINILFRKYGNLFSTVYSTYGMKARDKFENKLGDYYREINRVMREYKKELSSIVSDTADNSIDKSIKLLYDKLDSKTSSATSSKVKDIFNRVNEDSKSTMENCKYYIDWCRKTLNTEEIKSSIKYIIFNKLFG